MKTPTRLRVLIVDDSLTVRMDLSEAFDEAGFEVTLCATLDDARAALARALVAVVVLDVLLPDGDGVDLLAELRRGAATAALPIILLSSEAEVRDRVRGLTTGADEYVGKPYDRAYVVGRARAMTRGATGVEVASDRPTILIIDDSVTFREHLRDALTSAGYEVVVAASGEDGLRVAAVRRPSAIVVDGVMPGIDGATVIRRVRLDAALRAVPCVLLTASEGSGAELRAFDAGADAFVRKEEQTAVILAKLAAVLRHAPDATSQDAVTSLLGPKKVLAVDDSVTYLQALGATLREEGYEVSLARSGEQALELLSVQPVDCVLLDLVMPGLSGQDTCRRIKAAPIVRHIPIVMLTALEDREAMLQGLAAGADDYIPKSSPFEVLKARVRAQLRRKQFEDESRKVRDQLLGRELEVREARAARNLAETRAALADELARKNRELEAFSYAVSHDLRAPLRTINGFASLLLEEHSAALDDQGQDYLRRVSAAAVRMTELVDALLELSRVGRADLARGPVDLSKLARRALDSLARSEPTRSVSTSVQPDLHVDGDARLLGAVLDNLLGNAWKFTASSSPATIVFGAEVRDGCPVFFVRDNGAGFDMNHAGRLFTPFQRLHSEAEFPGTGIGLATVHRIVDRHGGRIWAEGTIGRGATFYFTIPAATP